MGIVKHFNHRHPLRLSYLVNSLLHKCDACSNIIYSKMYECKSCNYRLHERCLKLSQKILNPYHPHTLLYEELTQGVEIECSACCRKIQKGFFYGCQNCNFNLDMECAFHEPSQETFHHFGHFHPLELLNISSDLLKCSLCSKPCEGPTYSCRCRSCKFYVHQQCSLLLFPQQIQHPSHQCFLTLGTRYYKYRCFFTDYSCKNCKYYLKFPQALKHLSEKGAKKYYHFSHRHALTEQTNKDGQVVNCSACGKQCSALTYGCITCQYFLHQSCIDLPLEIRHFFHPCPLNLRIQPNSGNCGACDRSIQGFYFYCQWCNFSMDIECALLPTIKSLSKEEQFCGSSHGHPLTLTEIKDDDHSYCSACQRCCSGQAFVCRKCSFFLHKSCSELPREINHAFHPSHPLILQAKSMKVKSICNICCKNLNGLTYHCELCDFEMHTECNLPMPTVSYRGHIHLLSFLENLQNEVICNNCDTPCPADSSVFHCVECNFNLHLQCGPLPLTIKHESHYHPFILTHSPLEDESDQFCCDVCEKDRDPRLPVYYCKECLFPAEIKCLMSEVVLTLKGHYGEVELGNPDGQINGKVISQSLQMIELVSKEVQNGDKKMQETEFDKPSLTWNVMLNSLKEDEKIEMEGVLSASRRGIIVAGDTSSNDPRSDSEVSLFSCSDLIIAFSGDENMARDGVLAAQGREIINGTETSSNDQKEYTDSNLKLSLFTNKSYELFMEKLDSGTNYSPFTLWKDNEEVVNVSGNLIPQELAPILQKLSSKYGDVSEESPLSPQVKNCFTVMLCGTMHSMCDTRINEISANLLLNWWNNLKTLKFAGFKIQFALDHLEKVARAYFGLQVEKSEAELDIKITNISSTIEELTRECKALKEKRERIASAKYLKSSIIKDCLLEASTKRWQLGGAGLF